MWRGVWQYVISAHEVKLHTPSTPHRARTHAHDARTHLAGKFIRDILRDPLAHSANFAHEAFGFYAFDLPIATVGGVCAVVVCVLVCVVLCVRACVRACECARERVRACALVYGCELLVYGCMVVGDVMMFDPSGLREGSSDDGRWRRTRLK